MNSFCSLLKLTTDSFLALTYHYEVRLTTQCKTIRLVPYKTYFKYAVFCPPPGTISPGRMKAGRPSSQAGWLAGTIPFSFHVSIID